MVVVVVVVVVAVVVVVVVVVVLAVAFCSCICTCNCSCTCSGSCSVSVSASVSVKVSAGVIVHFFGRLNFQKSSETERLTFDFKMCFLPQRRAFSQHLNVQNWSNTVHVHLEMCFAPQRCALFRHVNFQKGADTEVLFYILTLKCASGHNGEHFLDISTSQSAPDPLCFSLFNFEICFGPQRRAIFHLSCGQMAQHPPL